MKHIDCCQDLIKGYGVREPMFTFFACAINSEIFIMKDFTAAIIRKPFTKIVEE